MAAVWLPLNFPIQQPQKLLWLPGEVELDNNRIKRTGKPFDIRRKNWMFCKMPADAEASAIL